MDNKRIYHMGGSVYYGEPPSGFLPKPLPKSSGKTPVCKKAVSHSPRRRIKGVLFLVDGDNHVYEALRGIETHSSRNRVIVYVTQDGLMSNLRSEFGNTIEIVKVEKGDQAVDNQIKTRLGNEIRNLVNDRNMDISIVSMDKGYSSIIQRYRKKYDLSEKELNLLEPVKDS